MGGALEDSSSCASISAWEVDVAAAGDISLHEFLKLAASLVEDRSNACGSKSLKNDPLDSWTTGSLRFPF